MKKIIIALTLAVLSISALAQTNLYPSWWITRGVITPSVPQENSQPANTGQLKWFVKSTHAEFEEELEPFGGAGGELYNIILGLPTGDNKDFVSQGLAKYASGYFYERLIDLWIAGKIKEAELTQIYPLDSSIPYPWSDDFAPEDYASINLGQLKYLFSFDFDRNNNGLPDWWDTRVESGETPYGESDDFDGDGLNNGIESSTSGTNPLIPDTDGDGLPDGWENDNELNPNNTVGEHGSEGNPDGDGLTNLEEYFFGTDPKNPETVDVNNQEISLMVYTPIH